MDARDGNRGRPAPPPKAWHARPADEAVLALETSTEGGLSRAVIAERQARFGANALHAPNPVRPLAILLAQFTSPLVALLGAAAIVATLLGDLGDGIAIGAIVVLNAIIGFRQEYGAETALAALRKMTAPKARVRRGGQAEIVDAASLVPGDILDLEAGDLVAADARLLASSALTAIEAALTGESVPTEKDARAVVDETAPLGDRATMVYAGTAIAAGRGVAVVVATGMSTEIGRIADLVTAAGGDQRTPLQRELAGLGRTLVRWSLAITLGVFLLGVLHGLPIAEVFLGAVSLAVAAVPEGLPAVVTIALAVGVQRMAKRRALVRRLPAVETLGSADVICSDKTGTLTVGAMTVRELVVPNARFTVSGDGYGREGGIHGGDPALALPALRVFVGCNGAALSEVEGVMVPIGDPTEAALLAAGAKLGLDPARIEAESPAHLELPFDSDRKRMTIVRRGAEGRFVAYVKGAPDVILARCSAAQIAGRRVPLDPPLRATLSEAIHASSSRGLRILAAAERAFAVDPATLPPEAIENDLDYLGFAGLADPPRPQAKDAVATCHRAGIRVVMITGDHPETARAIATELGILREGDEVVTGAELDRASEPELESRVPRIAVYARVAAEHKLRIVRALAATGAVAAMTGDGVNDAPAVRGAAVGVAMGRSGTEVTKEAADVVVTDDDFSSIVAAVEEGRGIYGNIRKALQYLLAGNAGELLLMTAAIACGTPLPLLPIQILWINLVTDGLPALCLATDPLDRDLMRRPPRKKGGPMADRRFLRAIGFAGLLTGATTLAVFFAGLDAEGIERARADAFTTLVFAEILKAFVFRNDRKTVFEVGLASNAKLLVVAVATGLLQVLAGFVPPFGNFLGMPETSLVRYAVLALVAAIPVTVLEVLKLAGRWHPSGRKTRG